MAQLFLPTAHTPADRALAARVAAGVECASLYVTWSPASGTTPAALAEPIREPARAPALALLAGAVAELWGRLCRPQGTAATTAQPEAPRRRPSPAA